MSVKTPPKVKERFESIVDLAQDIDSADNICAILLASLLDASLAGLLAARFVKCSTASNVLGMNSPLGTLAAKANVAYALGLISEGMRHNVDVVAKIRNNFAHKIDDLSFEDSRIQRFCETLVEPENVPISKTSTAVTMLRMNTQRARFENLAITMAEDILEEAERQDNPKRKTDKWPKPRRNA